MYYHVIIETTEKVGKAGKNKEYYQLDITDLKEIEDDIIRPYLQKNQVEVEGYFIQPKDIKRISIKETARSTGEYAKHENDNMPRNVIMFVTQESILGYKKYSKDISKQVLASVRSEIAAQEGSTSEIKRSYTLDKNKVFIVHGHDNLAKEETARFIEKIDFEPIILHEQASSGSTIIEKIEKYSNVGFGVVLYTPCDVGAKSADKDNLRSRARQNVVFEHGYLNGKLGRKNVCALIKGDVEAPNDISGVVYVTMDDHGAWKLELAKEMRAAGYLVDMNLVI